MQFPRFQTPNIFLKRYFQNNPEQLKNYVEVGLIAAKIVVTPLTAVLKHLIEIQGMDPNTDPGRRMREAFNEALNGVFQHSHDHEYDKDFDFSWLSKKFEEARKSNGKPFCLNKDDFRELTDVSSLQDKAPLFSAPATRATTEAGIPVTIDQSPLNELADLLGVLPVNQIAPEPPEQARDVFDEEAFADLHTAVHSHLSKLELPKDRSLKVALKKIVQFAKEFEEDNKDVDPKTLFAKTDFLKGLAKNLKQYGVPARPIKKTGKVHRTKTGNTKSVKETPRKSPKTTKKILNRNVVLDKNLTKPELEVERIQDLISRGLLDPKDFDALITEGLDFRSVNAWKEKYGDKHFTKGSSLKQNLRAKYVAATSPRR